MATLFSNLNKRVEESLSRAGLAPYKQGITGDGSWLMQFNGEVVACVDVYPSGEIVVLIERGEVDELYELGPDDLDLIASLLNPAK
jgi:hypothetical protein